MTMPLGEDRSARGFVGLAARSERRVEGVAPQPAGGGVAPRMPVTNTEELGEVRFKESATRNAQAGRAARQHDSMVDAVHPMIPALFAKIRPAAAITSPLLLAVRDFPGGPSLTPASRSPVHAPIFFRLL